MSDLAEAREVATCLGWLSNMPAAFRDAVLDRSALRNIKTGDVLQIGGDNSIGMYGVTRGMLRASIAMPEHGPYFVHLFRIGDWIGEGPSISGRPRVATLTAACDARLLFLPQRAIHEIVHQQPMHWRSFVVPLQGHLELAVGALADALMRDHTKRLIASLLRLGHVREGAIGSRGAIEIPATQDDIAVMANVARTTAHAVLQELADAGLIEVGYGKIALVDPRKLRALIRA